MKTTLLLLILLLPICVFSQTNQDVNPDYLPGGIISLNNDTILVDIKLESILVLQDKVKFIDASGTKKSFKPPIIKGFYFDVDDGGMVFESRNDVRVSAFPSKYGYFVNRVSNGICPLYYFELQKMKSVGMESKMVKVPYFLILKNNSWEYVNSDSFEDCINIFSDDIILVSNIKSGKYTFDDIPKMVEKYCKFLKLKQ